MCKKICKKCNIEKDLEEFSESKGAKDGYSSWCKNCHQQYIKDNVERYNELRKIRRRKDSQSVSYLNELSEAKIERINNRAKYLWKNAKARATKFNLPFDLEITDISIPEICPILLIPFDRDMYIGNMYAPSLDKVKPELGYVKGNIRVISRKANAMKSNASFEELKLFSENILNYLQQTK